MGDPAASPSPPPAESEDLTALVAGRYRRLSIIGRGGMGTVYRAADLEKTGGEVALKVLHRDAASAVNRARMLREGRVAAAAAGEHVVRVFEAGIAPELEGAPYIAMELLCGEDLGERVRRLGPLEAGEVVALLRQAATALDACHAVGIVHRDLKPQNLFLHEAPDGPTLKVIDFGLARFVAPVTSEESLTSTGVILGTLRFMAPEQTRSGQDTTGPAADLWALTLIALYLLTGESYWRSAGAELVASILRDPLVAPTARWPWLPTAIDGWFLRGCARDPALRFPSAREEIEALATALASFGHAALRAPQLSGASPKAATSEWESTSLAETSLLPGAVTPNAAVPTVKRRRGGWGLAAVGLVGAASLAIWQLRGDAKRPAQTAVPPFVASGPSVTPPIPSSLVTSELPPVIAEPSHRAASVDGGLPDAARVQRSSAPRGPHSAVTAPSKPTEYDPTAP